MTKTTWTLLVAGGLLLACAAPAALAEGAQNDQQAEPKQYGVTADPFTDEWFEQTKEPVEWFKWGADQRIRGIWDKRLMTVDEGTGNERWWQRYRSRFWGTVTPGIADLDMTFNFRLTWEWRNYCKPKGPLRDTDMDEVVFDNLNIKLNRPMDWPVTLTLGRQDIVGINNWLLLEGTPLDGSRTIYFDAVRADLDLADWKTKVHMIFINNFSQSNQWLPPINDRHKILIEHRERGGVLYVSNTSIPDTRLDGYFIVKHDMGSDWKNDAGIEPFRGSDRTTYTVGARAAGKIMNNEQWEYDAQFAQQMGHQDGAGNICASGALGKLLYHTKDEWNSTVYCEYEYRSGDDPSTGHREDFNILWGRYPQWSNIYEGYMDTFEGKRPAFAANIHRINLGWKFNPFGAKDHTITTDYHLLLADQNEFGETGRPTAAGDRTLTKSGCVRGHLLTGLWQYTFNQHLKTHLVGEVLFPGDYYTEEKNEPVIFLRYEIVLSW